MKDKIGFNHDYLNSEWEITGISAEIKNEKEIRSDELFSEFVFNIHGVRHYEFYIKAFFPFYLIIIISWSVFL